MQFIKELFSVNEILTVSIVGWFVAQVLKTIINFILLGKFQLERMWGDGGMPSAHSATVCAMVIAAARSEGVSSAIFAVASVVAIITMHDAMGVRHETGEQAKVLNQMIEEWIDISEKNAPFLQNMHLKEMVGHTPLLRLHKLEKNYRLKARLLAKCEFYNPLFSVKDRIALSMLDKAEKSGKINANTVFVEATSGNTGIALAALCAAKGYKLVIVMPENMSQERIKLMRHFGAEVILTPAEDGMKGSIAKADILAEKSPDVILLRQFENEANPDAHRLGTSMEIMEDTGGEVDCLVSAVGTSGTLTGIASALKTCNPDLYVVAVEPAESPLFTKGHAGPHAIQGIGANFIPKISEGKHLDGILTVKGEDAIAQARELAQKHGIFCGISAGANVCAAQELTKKYPDKLIVAIIPDSGERYLSVW